MRLSRLGLAILLLLGLATLARFLGAARLTSPTAAANTQQVVHTQ